MKYLPRVDTMLSNGGVTVSLHQVEEWQEQLEEAEARARNLRRRIDAARILLAEDDAGAPEEAEPEAKNFMGTIADLVNATSAPISKGSLKEMLRKKGFPEHQVGGTYFYVALRKLDGVGRITIQKNGNLTKGTRE